MLETIGNTPLVRLQNIPPDDCADIWIKVEGGNPTGSYKDRMALAMVEGVERRGELYPYFAIGMHRGSTGSSLAFVCAVKGHKITIISSDAYAQEKLASMRAFGADLLVEPSRDGRVTPDLWPRMIDRANKLAAAGTHIYLNQFHNADAPIGYEKMGHEILEQLPQPIDALCGAVGTAGMIMGVGSVVRKKWHQAQIVALEPDTSPMLSGGTPGDHNIDGTAAGFIPPLFSRDVVTDVLALPEAEARSMARRLAKEEGIFAGTSTGMNVVAALQLAKKVGKGGTVVTVACDNGFKYLNGELYR